MKRVYPQIPLMVAAVLLLQSCGDGINLNNNVIDPAGGLTRNDYLYLRHRADDAPPPEAASTPPIPHMQAQVVPPAPAQPGTGKLVSVTVTDSVPLRDVLIELARDANVNLELDPRVSGGIIFSAHSQPFDQVLKRICMLAGLRATADGAFIHIEPDDAYQQTYQLDYLSLARKSSSEMAISTNVFDSDVTSTSALNGATGNVGSSSHGGGDNNSTAKLTAASEADFWSEVDHSLTQILGAGHEGKGTGSFSIDRQSGMVTVFGNSHQQSAIDDYFHKLKRKAYAQVLIDARVIEVELDETYKSGINWRTLFGGAFNAAARFGPAAAGSPFSTASTATSGVITGDVDTHDFAAILNLMRSFGTTRVLSAPRLTVMNNQTAVLKVATNQVYFVTQAQFTTVTNANGSSVTTNPVYTSTPHTVPVGLVMTVQPSIDADRDRVTMTLRPTISRVVGEANDPSIDLNAAIANVATPIESQIPVLAVREMDSVLQLHSGEIAVMGGLMQDSSTNTDTGAPVLDTLPVVGALAKGSDNESTTTELVILLRATISDNPPPEGADRELYHHYNNDPRPWPMQPLPTSTLDRVPDALAPEKNDPL